MCGRQTTIDVDVLMYGVIIYRQYRLLMKILTDSYKLCTLNHQFDVIWHAHYLKTHAHPLSDLWFHHFKNDSNKQKNNGSWTKLTSSSIVYL